MHDSEMIQKPIDRDETFSSLLEERKPLEKQLRAWYARWEALHRARGLPGDPFSVLYPIDKLVTESEEERAARCGGAG